MRLHKAKLTGRVLTYCLGYVFNKHRTLIKCFCFDNEIGFIEDMATLKRIPDDFQDRLESVIETTNENLYVTATEKYLPNMKAFSLLLDSKVEDATFVLGGTTEPMFLMSKETFKNLFFDIDKVSDDS